MIQLNWDNSRTHETIRLIMQLEKFSEKLIHFKTWFLFETIRNSSKQ